MSFGVDAVTALAGFGEVWTPFMFARFPRVCFGGPLLVETLVFAGCQCLFNCLLKFLKDNYYLKGFWLIHTPRVFS